MNAPVLHGWRMPSVVTYPAAPLAIACVVNPITAEVACTSAFAKAMFGYAKPLEVPVM